jgi:hypothetical protein
MPIDFIEGDFIEDTEDIIYDVKGYEHPPDGVIAYPRYIPSPVGDRVKDREKYIKLYDLAERIAYIKSNLPNYYKYDEVFGRELCIVPLKKIKRHYKPPETIERFLSRLESLSKLENLALNLSILISGYSGIPLNNIGVSGSLMVGLSKEDSDIDIIIYGDRESRSALKGIKRLFNEGIMRPLDKSGMRNLYKFRKAGYTIPYELFINMERRKLIQGVYEDTEFFIRFVKKAEELDEYGYYRYRPLGRVWLEGEVYDASDAIFTPSRYLIKVSNIELIGWKSDLDLSKKIIISSFRGRYSQHINEGETVVVEGLLEEIYRKDELYGYRVLIGESVKDYIIVKDIYD